MSEEQAAPPAKQPEEEFFNDLAVPLKIISYIFFAITALVFALALVDMVSYGNPFSTGLGITLIILASIGIGLRKAAKYVASGKEPDIALIGFWAFAGFGGVMVLVGIIIAFDDPAGLFASLFGAVFIGVGFLVRKLFSAPEGKKAVTVSGTAVTVSSSRTGGNVKRTSRVQIYVDENATEEEVELAKAQWATQRFMSRPDWVSGELRDERSKHGSGVFIAAGLFGCLFLGMLTLALVYGDFWWFMTVVVGLMAAAAVGGSVHTVLHNRKFGESVLVLEQTPLRLGGQLRAELRSGVASTMQSHSPFKITLACVHRWEETERTGKDTRRVMRSERLWEQQVEGDAVSELSTHHRVPIVIDLPSDQPESSLGSSREGNFWELSVHLPLPGLDYRAEFVVPVLDPETKIDPSCVGFGSAATR